MPQKNSPQQTMTQPHQIKTETDNAGVHALCGGSVTLDFTKSLLEGMIAIAKSEAEIGPFGPFGPCYDTLILGAIAMLELAVNCAPCTGPEGQCWDAIEACKKAMLWTPKL